MGFLAVGRHHVLDALGKINADSLLGQQIHQQRTRFAVSLGLESGLALPVLVDIVQVHVEQVGRVKGPTLGLGMELRREDGARLMDQTFNDVSMF